MGARALGTCEPVSSTSADDAAGRGRRMLRTSRFCCVDERRGSRSREGARSRRDGSSSATGPAGAASCPSCGAAGRATGTSRSGAFAAGSTRSGGTVVATTAVGGGTVATAGGGPTEGVVSGWIVSAISARGGGLRQGRTSTAVPMLARRAHAARTDGTCRPSAGRGVPRGASGPMRSSGPGASSKAESGPRLGRSHAGRRGRVRSASCIIGSETTAEGARSNPSVLCVVQGMTGPADVHAATVRQPAGDVHDGRSRARGPRECCR